MTADMAETVPTKPLIDWWQSNNKAHIDDGRGGCPCLRGGWCNTTESLARRIRVSHSTVFRRIRDGRLTIDEADLWSVRAGVHPSNVWPHWDRIKACGGRCNGHPNALDDDRRRAIVAALGAGSTQAAVARRYGVSPRTVSNIARQR